MLDPNIAKLSAQLGKMTDEQLAEVLRSGSAPAYLVMSEMERRKQVRAGGQETPPGTVADELVDGAGLAKFAAGGEVDLDSLPERERRAELVRRRAAGIAPATATEYNRTPMGPPLRTGRGSGVLPSAGVGGAFVGPMPDDREGGNGFVGPVAPAELVDDPMAKQYAGLMQAAYGPVAAGTVPVGKLEDMDYYRKMLGEPPQQKPVTDEENFARQQAFLKAHGQDFSQERAAQAERRAGLAQQQKNLPWQTALQLGLGMMSAKNTGFLGAVGEAGLSAADFYAKAKQAERVEMDAIRRGDMELARAAHAEKIQALNYATAANRDDRAVAASNQRAVQDRDRTALGMRMQDQQARAADIRHNSAAIAAASRERAAAARSMLTGLGKDQFTVPGYANDTAKEIFKATSERLYGELEQLKALAASGKLVGDREGLARYNALKAPGAIEALAAQAQQRYMGQHSLPMGPMNKRTGIGLSGTATNAVDLSR